MNAITAHDKVAQTEGEHSAGRTFPWIVRFLGRLIYGSILLFLVLLWLWTSGAIYFLLPMPYWLRAVLSLTYLLAVPWILYRSKQRWRIIRIPLAVSLIVLLLQTMIRPSNDREWSADQEKLPRAEILGSQVTIENIRDIYYQDLEQYEVRYHEETFDLNEIDSIWYGVQEFSSLQPLAHTFLTFAFRDGKSFQYISVSVEIRREKGEEFSPVTAMFKQFELMYVVAEERDVLGRRSIFRPGDIVYLYPMKADRQQRKELFLDVIERTNELAEHPEFYHTLTSNCTNNLVYHLNRLAPGTVTPRQLGIVFPGYSDRVAFRLGLIDTKQSFAETKRRYRVDQLARELADKKDFSYQLRRRLQER